MRDSATRITNSRTIRSQLWDRDEAMHIFSYLAIGYLIVCTLSAGTKALSAETASAVIAVADQVVAPDTTQSPRQPSPGEDEDLLSTLD